jgi:protease-4
MDKQKTNEEIMSDILMAGIKEQKSNRRWKIFFRFIWLSLIIFIIYSIYEKNRPVMNNKSAQVALINLKGEISLDAKTYELISQGLNEALNDPNTKSVIIKANSPGGSPVYSDMLYNEILSQRKKHPKVPIDVVIEEVCASGCYYIASAANHIYSARASIVGSIGVIYAGFGFNRLMDKLGIDNRLLTAGNNKAMGYPFSTVNQEQILMQQRMLNQIHQQFINAVKNGRGKRLKLDNPELFSGRYWIGEDAYQLGLIDGFFSVNQLAKDIYKINNVVDFTPTEDAIDKITKKLGVSLLSSIKNLVSINEFNLFR